MVPVDVLRSYSSEPVASRVPSCRPEPVRLSLSFTMSYTTDESGSASVESLRCGTFSRGGIICPSTAPYEYLRSLISRRSVSRLRRTGPRSLTDGRG